jgi:hypothetical protein
MLNSGKKIHASRDKKHKYSNSRDVRKKNITPPFKLNGRSLMGTQDPLVLVVLIWMY